MLKRSKQGSRDRIAIDLGAYYTRFYSATEGLLLDQPSIATLDMDHPAGGASAVRAFGDHAQTQLVNQIEDSGTEPLRPVSPLQSDAHNDLGLSNKMLGYFLQQGKRSGLIKKNSAFCLVLPHGTDEKVRDKFTQTCLHAGATDVSTMDAAMTAYKAISADQSAPCVLIDFGASDSRLIAIADGQVRNFQSLACGGDKMDRTIVKGLLDRFDLQVKESDAREIKHRIGGATPKSLVQTRPASMPLNCLSVGSNTATQFRVSSDTVSAFLQPLMDELSQAVRLAFAAVDNDIKEVVYENGIQLCGGGALLSRIDQLVMAATDMPVEIVKRPATCGVRGAATQFTEIVPPLELLETA